MLISSMQSCQYTQHTLKGAIHDKSNLVKNKSTNESENIEEDAAFEHFLASAEQCQVRQI